MTWLGYTFAQWALFFFLYSFLGWIWESGYVSFREHRWVNRGFLNGPFLPIYGFGAISILMFTLPVAQSSLLVFLMGMTGATLLEYITGSFMEKLFHVRYWDYRMYRWNLNGYICLPASLCWGAFSLLMLRFIHPLVSGQLTRLSAPVALAIALVLSAALFLDALVSLREAVDMNSILKSLSESRRRIARLQKRYEVQAAFAPNGLMGKRDASRTPKTLFGRSLSTRLQALRQQRQQLLAALDEKIRRSAETDSSASSALVQNELGAMNARTDSMYRRTVRHLHRNPGMTSDQYPHALEEMEPLLYL